MALFSNLSTVSDRTPVAVRLYDSHNIKALPWPHSSEADYAKKFLLPLMSNGLPHYAGNIHIEMMTLTVNEHIIPLTINHATHLNSFVCSAYGHYVTCAKEALAFFKPTFVQKPLQLVVSGMGNVLKTIDRAVFVNNWLFSTDLHGPINQKEVAAIKETLIEKFPGHAIIFRSIHTYENSDLYHALKKEGFDLIASRQIFFFQGKNEEAFRSRIFKSDLKIIREMDYEIITNKEITPTDIPRLAQLYHFVYTDKHSQQNPQWNEEFIRLAIEQGILEILAIRKNGQIDAVAGFYCRNGVLISPFLGHDTTQSQENKLYRIISTLLYLEARKRKMILHLSSGATFYKKIRKAENVMEYMAVYRKHLPIRRQIPWKLLKGVANALGPIGMKLFKG